MYILKNEANYCRSFHMYYIFIHIIYLSLIENNFSHIIYSDYGFLPATPPSSIPPFYPIQIHSLSVSH